MWVAAGLLVALVASIVLKNYAQQVAHRNVWQYPTFYAGYMHMPLVRVLLPLMVLGMYAAGGLLVGSWIAVACLLLAAVVSVVWGIRSAANSIFGMLVSQNVSKGMTQDAAEKDARQLMKFMVERHASLY